MAVSMVLDVLGFVVNLTGGALIGAFLAYLRADLLATDKPAGHRVGPEIIGRQLSNFGNTLGSGLAWQHFGVITLWGQV